jgi:hypothetical protein
MLQPAAKADSTSLQDWEFNVNGTTYFPSGGATLGTVPGLNSAGFNSTTGLGTLTLTFNPGAAGSYFVGGFFYTPVGVPFYNNHGVVNGATGAGQSWQIDVPQYDLTTANHGPGTIIDNLAAGALDNTNHIPGHDDNFGLACGANGGNPVNTNCNDFVSLAQGFHFSLNANQEEIITFSFSTTDPGGFTLEAVHPVDSGTTAQQNLFFSASAQAQCVGPTCGGAVPEPSSLNLMATAGVMGMLALALKSLVAKKGECK